MKCKICGHRTNTIASMRAHYAKKHPAALKRRHKGHAKGVETYYPGIKYCPVCGKRLDNPCKR